MEKNMQKYLLQTFALYFICIATVKSLQSSRFFDYSVKLSILKCFL